MDIDVDHDDDSDTDIFVDDDGDGSDMDGDEQDDDGSNGDFVDDEHDHDWHDPFRPASPPVDAVDAVDALCTRFLEAWVLHEPHSVLMGILDEYQGSSGHLLLHPCDPISRSVFSASIDTGGEFGQRRGGRGIDQCVDFFRLLLNSKPDLRRLQSPESGVTLLHVALYHNASIEVIRLVACHDVVTYQDGFGRTPLYLACHRSPPGVKQYLFELDVGREAARIADAEGQLPLHLACQKDPMDPFVDQLIDAYPEGLSHKHSKGVTPVLGAFWHQEDPIDGEIHSQGKLERLFAWVLHHPDSIQTFNSSNLETALACACRHVYSTGEPDRIENENLHLCRALILEYPVALGMTVAMTLPGQRHVELPYPFQIASVYNRSNRILHTLALATLQLVRSFVQLVLHPTFSQSGTLGRLRRHAIDVVDRYFPSNAGEGPSSGMVASRSMAAIMVEQVADPDWRYDGAPSQEGNLDEWFPEDMCTELFRNYDARTVQKSDGHFRDALNALFQMNHYESRDLLLFQTPASARPKPTAMTLERYATLLSNGTDNLTAVFVHVREFFPGLASAVQSLSS